MLFDLDGTLVTLWDIHYRVYEATFRELYGIPNVNFREKYVAGKAPEDIVRDVLKNRGYDDNFIEPKIPLVSSTMGKNYLPSIKDGKVEILPGVIGLLQEFSERNILCGIITGNEHPTCDAILEKAELGKYFAFGVTASESRDRKERMRIAMRESERIIGSKVNPYDIYFFDDSYEGIEISRSLGIRHISVATGVTDYETLLKANSDSFKSLKNTDEILKVLRIE